MSGEIEKAKLFTVAGPVDNPRKGSKSISVMFNPTSLKVTLANTLKENERNSNSRAAQYVDKSSSSLSVDLIFDSTTVMDKRTVIEEGKRKEITTDMDVRKYTGAIANEFMKQADVGDENAEPKRCMFAWGTFIFVGIMENFEETLDFFSWEGTPLRATVAIKLTESRFQFRSAAAKEAARNTPQLGNDSDLANGGKQPPRDWRDKSLYNGNESPRMPSTDSLVSPSVMASANLSASLGVSAGAGISGGLSMGASASIGGGISGSAGIGISGGLSASASIGGGISGGINTSGGLSTSIMKSTPAFNFGASSSIGTGIPGAFSPNTKNCVGLTAGNILAVSAATDGITTKTSSSVMGSALSSKTKANASGSVQIGSNGIKASGSLGFD